MQMIGKLALAAGAILWISSAGAQPYGDDSTTTHTTVHHDHDHGSGVDVGVPGVAGVHVGSGHSGCETRSKTVRDEDTGESHTHTETRC